MTDSDGGDERGEPAGSVGVSPSASNPPVACGWYGSIVVRDCSRADSFRATTL